MATSTALTTDLEQQLEEFVTVYDQEFARAAATVGLSAAQACVLGWTETQMPMSALARVLACDASNVSQIVGRLEAHKLVERTADTGDRRVKIVRMTPAGRRVYRRVRAQFDFAREGLGRLDAGEREQLGRLLAKMSGADEPAP